MSDEQILQKRARLCETLPGEVVRVACGDIEDLQDLELSTYESAIKLVEEDL